MNVSDLIKQCILSTQDAAMSKIIYQILQIFQCHQFHIHDQYILLHSCINPSLSWVFSLFVNDCKILFCAKSEDTEEDV